MAKNQGGEKICEVLLNLINCLLDLDIIERKTDTEKKTEDTDKKVETPDGSASTCKTPDGNGSKTIEGSGSKKGDMTSFGLAMDSIVRYDFLLRIHVHRGYWSY